MLARLERRDGDRVMQVGRGGDDHRIDVGVANHLAVVGVNGDVGLGLKVRQELIADRQGVAGDVADRRTLRRRTVTLNVSHGIFRFPRAESRNAKAVEAGLA